MNGIYVLEHNTNKYVPYITSISTVSNACCKVML